MHDRRPAGYRNYWTSEHLTDLPDAAIEAIASRSEAMPAGLSQLFMVSWGGAVARVGQNASPLSARDARFVVHPFGMWRTRPTTTPTSSGRAASAMTSPPSPPAPYTSTSSATRATRACAPATGPAATQRLARVKAAWDPDNLFRASGDVPPPTAVAKAA